MEGLIEESKEAMEEVEDPEVLAGAQPSSITRSRYGHPHLLDARHPASVRAYDMANRAEAAARTVVQVVH